MLQPRNAVLRFKGNQVDKKKIFGVLTVNVIKMFLYCAFFNWCLFFNSYLICALNCVGKVALGHKNKKLIESRKSCLHSISLLFSVTMSLCPHTSFQGFSINILFLPPMLIINDLSCVKVLFSETSCSVLVIEQPSFLL